MIKRCREILEDIASGNTTRHCIVPKDQQTENDTCPTDDNLNNRFPFVCPCLDGNPTSRWQFEQGAALVFTLPGIVAQWVSEWHKFVDTSFPGMPRLYVAHSATDLPASMRFNQDDKSQALFLQDGRPRPGAENFVILTTSLSYKGQLKKKMPVEADDGVAWGLVIRDESHLEKSRENEQFRAIKSLNRKGEIGWHPFIFCYTGTPLANMLKGLEAWVLEQRERFEKPFRWHESPALKHVCPEWFGRVDKTYHSLQKLDINSDEYKSLAADLAAMVHPLLQEWMIRHHVTTRIFDKVLVELPPQVYYDIECPTLPGQHENLQMKEDAVKSRFRNRIQQLNDAQEPIDVKKLLDLCLNQRLCTNFPELTVMQNNGEVCLTMEEILNKNWHIDPESSSYYKHIDKLYQSSSKLQQLWKMVSAISKQKHGLDKLPEGTVVMAEHGVSALIISCVSRLIPQDLAPH
jgi:hypothetical protein